MLYIFNAFLLASLDTAVSVIYEIILRYLKPLNQKSACTLSNMKESLHTYAGLAELIISQRFINSASVKSAIDIIIIRMNELSSRI